MPLSPLELIPMPDRIKRLPQDHRGYPIPWFVDWHDGAPVFPAFDPLKYVMAVKQKRCWVCGDTLGRNVVFVVGPMCVINRISSEPPSHYECAHYSAQVCPFLANPRMRRVPDEKIAGGIGVQSPGGIMVPDNPGLCALITTRGYNVMETHNGPIIRIDTPTNVSWYREGRPATSYEAAEGFVLGAARLMTLALQEEDHEASKLECQRMVQAGMLYLPDPLLARGLKITPSGEVVQRD